MHFTFDFCPGHGHGMFLEWGNTTGGLSNICQHFSRLLDEGIPKIWKKLNPHDSFLSYLLNSKANSAHLAAHFCPALVCLKEPQWEFNFFHIFGIPSSSRHEKYCQMLERLFALFHHSRNIPCAVSGCCCCRFLWLTKCSTSFFFDKNFMSQYSHLWSVFTFKFKSFSIWTFAFKSILARMLWMLFKCSTSSLLHSKMTLQVSHLKGPLASWHLKEKRSHQYFYW